MGGPSARLRGSVAGPARGEDGSKMAPDAFLGHTMRLPFENAVPPIILMPSGESIGPDSG
jgi:hypothetical protein